MYSCDITAFDNIQLLWIKETVGNEHSKETDKKMYKWSFCVYNIHIQ